METTRSDAPLLLIESMSESDAFCPRFQVKDPGLTAISGAPTAEPVIDTVALLLVSSLELIVAVALLSPASVGAYVTVTVCVSPIATVKEVTSAE